MTELLGSISWLGWAAVVLAVYGLATLPRAFRELMRRPWRGDDE